MTEITILLFFFLVMKIQDYLNKNVKTNINIIKKFMTENVKVINDRALNHQEKKRRGKHNGPAMDLQRT